MALAGSVYGTSTVGLHLAQKLYELGSAPSPAKEQIDYVASHVNLCSTVIEMLAQRLEESPLMASDKAKTLVKEVDMLSLQTFDGIEDLFPHRKDGVFQDSKLMKKFGWPLQKTRIDLIAGELGYLRFTANLLLTVLCLARVTESQGPELNRGRKNGHEDKALRQRMKAESALVEFINAGDRLLRLEEQKVKEAPLPKTQSKDVNKPKNGSQSNGASSLVSQWARIMCALTPSLRAATTQSQRPTSILTESHSLLVDLLKEWTVPDIGDDEEERRKKKHWSVPLSPPRTPAPTIREFPIDRPVSPTDGESVSYDRNRDCRDSWPKGGHENIEACRCHPAPTKKHIPEAAYDDSNPRGASVSARARPAKRFHTLEELAELKAAFSESEKEPPRASGKIRERFGIKLDREMPEGYYLKRDRGRTPVVRSSTPDRSGIKLGKEVPEGYYLQRDRQGSWFSKDDWDNPRLATRYPREETHVHGVGDALHIRTSNLGLHAGHHDWQTRSASPRYANHNVEREDTFHTNDSEKEAASDEKSGRWRQRRDTCSRESCCHSKLRDQSEEL